MSAAAFDVTVPTTLSIHMDANGGITCGDIVITNNGTESVVVEEAQVTALNGWTLVDYATTTFTDANKGQHKVALQLGSLDGSIAASGGQKTVDVAAKIPYQGVRIVNAPIAQVVFVLGWHESIPDAGIDWEYYTSGDVIVLNKYIGADTNVVVRNKYQVDGIVYDEVKMGNTNPYHGINGPFSSQWQITSISFEPGVSADSSYCMFFNCGSLSVIDMSGLTISDIYNTAGLEGAFNNCVALKTIYVESSAVKTKVLSCVETGRPQVVVGKPSDDYTMEVFVSSGNATIIPVSDYANEWEKPMKGTDGVFKDFGYMSECTFTVRTYRNGVEVTDTVDNEIAWHQYLSEEGSGNDFGYGLTKGHNFGWSCLVIADGGVFGTYGIYFPYVSP